MMTKANPQNSISQMPGYTGYKPSHLLEQREQETIEANTVRQQEYNPTGPAAKVPGYQGYVPGIRSENVFGNTYGSVTVAQQEGRFTSGFDCENRERYKSVSQDVYTTQMTQKVVGADYRQPGYAAAKQGSGAITLDYSAAQQAAREKQLKENTAGFYGV